MSLNDNATMALNFNADFTDSIGSNDGTASGAIIDTSVKKLGAGSAYLDGTNDKITVTDSADLDATTALSLGIWVKRARSGQVEALFQKWNAAGGDQRSFQLRFNADNTIRLFVDRDGDGTVAEGVTSIGAIADTDWHRIITTWDTTNKIIYLDGSLDISQSSTISGIHAGTSNMQIGVTRQTGVDSWHYKGNYDVAVLWKNRAITSAEVTADWNGGAGLEYPVAASPGIVIQRRRMEGY